MRYIEEFSNNRIFLSAIASWFIAQLIKLVLEIARNRTVNPGLLMSSGGMPSSHSSFVTAMSMSVGIHEGFFSSMFAISAVLSLIVMYDAAGVRRAAGKQAEVINMLVTTLENQGVTLDKKLKELLGHSPIEVFAGAILGIVVAIVFNL